MNPVELTCNSCGKPFTWWQRSTIKPVKCSACLWKESSSNSKNKNSKFTGWNKKNIEKPAVKHISKKKSNGMTVADGWFSKYIRVKYSYTITADGTVVCMCYTCSKLYSANKITNGHYHSRRLANIRYNEDNARPQCISCNSFKQGMHTEFRANLIKEIGVERVESLDFLAGQKFKVHPGFYREMSDIYRVKFNEICKEKSVKKW